MLGKIDWKNLYDVLTDKYNTLENSYRELENKVEETRVNECLRTKKRIYKEFIEVLDDIEKASKESLSKEDLLEAVRLIHKKTLSVLRKEEVEVIECTKGDKFDPELHQAMAVKGEDGIESNCILETSRNGFKIGNIIIRPAEVIVSE